MDILFLIPFYFIAFGIWGFDALVAGYSLGLSKVKGRFALLICLSFGLACVLMSALAILYGGFLDQISVFTFGFVTPALYFFLYSVLKNESRFSDKPKCSWQDALWIITISFLVNIDVFCEGVMTKMMFNGHQNSFSPAVINAILASFFGYIGMLFGKKQSKKEIAHVGCIMVIFSAVYCVMYFMSSVAVRPD